MIIPLRWLKKKTIISLLRIRCSLFVKIKVPSIYGCFASSLVGFEGEDFNKLLNLVNEFSLFRYYLAFEKSLTLHLSKFQSPSLKLVCTVALEKKMCKFSLFRYYLIMEKCWPFIWTINTKFLHPRMLCTNFGWSSEVVLEQKMKMKKVYRQSD